MVETGKSLESAASVPGMPSAPRPKNTPSKLSRAPRWPCADIGGQRVGRAIEDASAEADQENKEPHQAFAVRERPSPPARP